MEVYVELAKDFETQQNILLDLLENFDTPFGKITLELIEQRACSRMSYSESRHFGFLLILEALERHGNI